MSKEPGQLGDQPFMVRYTISLWERNDPDAVAAIRADERARVIEECAKWHDERHALFEEMLRTHKTDRSKFLLDQWEHYSETHEASAAALRSKIGESNG